MEITDIILDEKQRGAKVKKCNCYHPWADKRYGIGRRVHNRKKDNTWRCTTCGRDN